MTLPRTTHKFTLDGLTVDLPVVWTREERDAFAPPERHDPPMTPEWDAMTYAEYRSIVERLQAQMQALGALADLEQPAGERGGTATGGAA